MTDEPIEQRFNDLRRRILQGEEPTEDEMVEIVRALAGRRQQAAQRAEKKAQGQQVDLDKLFNGGG